MLRTFRTASARLTQQRRSRCIFCPQLTPDKAHSPLFSRVFVGQTWRNKATTRHTPKIARKHSELAASTKHPQLKQQYAAGHSAESTSKTSQESGINVNENDISDTIEKLEQVESGDNDAIGRVSEKIQAPDLEPGDLIEITKGSYHHIGILLEKADRQKGTKNTTLLTNRYKFTHLTGDIQFRIPGYAFSNEIARYTSKPLTLADLTQEPLDEGVFTALARFQRDSRGIMASKYVAFQKLVEKLEEEYPEDGGVKTVTVDEVAQRLYDTPNPTSMQLYAAYKLMTRDNMRFAPGRVIWKSREYEMRNREELGTLERVVKLLRENSPTLHHFRDKAQLLISNRKDGGALEQGIEFDDHDRLYIQFLKNFINDSADDLWSPYTVYVPQLIKPVKAADYERIDRNTVTRFLRDIGVFPEWENPHVYSRTMPLSGTGLSKQADRDAEDGGKWSRELLNHSSFTFHPKGNCPRATPLIKQSGSPSEFYSRDPCEDIRYDFGDMPVYTIDDPTAQELDDGLSIERIGDDVWLHVHVADPTAYIPPTHPLSNIARRQGQTIYLPERSYSMLPPELSKQRFSLRSGVPEGLPVLTFSAKMGRDGNLADITIRPGVVRRVLTLNYDDVDEFLGWSAVYGGRERSRRMEQTRFSYPTTFAPPPGSKILSPIDEEMKKDLLQIQSFSLQHAAYRYRCGAFNFSLPAPILHLDPSPLPPTPPSPRSPLLGVPPPSIHLALDRSFCSPSRLMVAEMMIIGGRVAARFCGSNGINIGYRTQADPLAEHRADVEKVLVHRDPLSGMLPAESVLNIVGAFPAADLTSNGPGSHWIMGIKDGYTKATSPLRRYLDLVTHWQIKASLLGEKPAFSLEEINTILPHVRERERRIARLQTLSNRHWIMLLVQQLLREEELRERVFSMTVLQLDLGGACLGIVNELTVHTRVSWERTGGRPLAVGETVPVHIMNVDADLRFVEVEVVGS
ncbi:uncharacterized protein VTP21DRAFT_2169 [Calcarisporiella thermophila]|uniref:uncharacterized protein n=1 Tax=Calcarisporiella thermophila TaxID=911321 RepID=UPI0037422F8E